MSMQSGLYRDYLVGLAKEGTLGMETLDEAVRRTRLKGAYGCDKKSLGTSWFYCTTVETCANLPLMWRWTHVVALAF